MVNREIKKGAKSTAQRPLAHGYWRGGWKGLRQRVFDEAVRQHYTERPTSRRVERCRLASGVISADEDNEAVGVNEEHGVDFINEVIPRMLGRLTEEGLNRKLRILDLGCGFGFFTDELRQRFGDCVDVIGTSVENPVQKEIADAQKKAVIEGVRAKTHKLSAACTDVKLQEQVHPNDAKFRSVLEMRQFPKFDLIIDTSGEFLYAGKGFLPTDSYSDLMLEAAIGKLAPKGELYVSRVHSRDLARIEALQRGQTADSPVQVVSMGKGDFQSAFVITKA